MFSSGIRHRATRCWIVGCVVAGSMFIATGCNDSSSAVATGSSTSGTGVQPGTFSVLPGPARSLTAPVNGSNLDYFGVGQPFSSPEVITALQTFNSGTLRYPGGTIANYWHWQSGTVDQPTQTTDDTGQIENVPGSTHTYGFTLRTLRSIVQETGTTPVFDLNVLTSSLADQLAMLRRASALGIPVRYIELGNELYLSYSTYTRAFPTAASYADLVAKWAPQIHASFPGAEIAAVGSQPQDTPRERSWNSTVLSIAGSEISALTLHDYDGLNLNGGGNGLRGVMPVGKLLAYAYDNWQKTQKVMAAIPPRYPIWITEFNLPNLALTAGSPPLGATWAHGLYMADMLMLFDQSARVQLDDYWDLFSSPISGVYTSGPHPSLTAAGSALIALSNASRDASSVTALSFPGAPTVHNGAPGLVGVSFKGPHGIRTVLLNLTGQAMPLATGAVIPRGTAAESISGNPAAVVSGPGSLDRRTETVGSSLLLPAYAVVTVGFSLPGPARRSREMAS
jgi:hypothetical protein